jgi:signal transduction histidine kinase
MTNNENSESEKVRETVRAEERHRLALDLHDTLGQVLALTKLQLVRIQQALRQQIHPDRQAWLQTTIDALIPEIDLAMQTVQTQVFSLTQPVFKGGELASAFGQ